MFNKKKYATFNKWVLDTQKKHNPITATILIIIVVIIGVGVNLLISSFLIFALITFLGLIVNLPTWMQLSFGQCFLLAIIFAIVRTLFRLN